jgi:hypothetical protein
MNRRALLRAAVAAFVAVAAPIDARTLFGDSNPRA